MASPRLTVSLIAALGLLVLVCEPVIAQDGQRPKRGRVRTPIPGSTTRTAQPGEDDTAKPGSPLPDPSRDEAEPARNPGATSFADLAREISDPYWTDPAQVGSAQASAVNLAGWGEALKDSPIPALRDAGRELLAGWEKARHATARVQGIVDATGENLDAVLDGALRGDYTVQREQVVITTDRHGQPQARTESYTEDASALPLIGSAALYGWVAMNAPAAAQRQAMLHMEAARCRAWTAVMGHMDDLYAGAAASKGLVQLELKQDKDGNRLLSAVNASGRKLKRVTLVVDLVHFTSSPYPAVRRFHYLDEWAPGQRVYFSLGFVPNVGSPPLRERRPTITSPNTSPDPDVRALAGIGGVTRVVWRVWSAEAVAEAEDIVVPDAATRASRWELACAYRLTTITQRVMSNPVDPKTGRRAPPPRRSDGPEPIVPPARPETIEAPAKARAFVERVLTIAAPGSAEAEEAALFLRNPHQAFRAHRQKTLDRFMAALPRGAVFEGQWVLPAGAIARGPGPAFNRDPKPKADSGRFTMRVVSVTSQGTATVLLQDAGDQRRQRRLSGQVEIDGSSLVLHLVPVEKDPTGRPASITSPADDFYSAFLHLRLVPVGDGFAGHFGPRRSPATGYEVALARTNVVDDNQER